MTETNGETETIIDKAIELTTLPAFNRAEWDVQISTAKKYPRSIRAFLSQALEMSTLDEETAGSMFYVLPRDGKRIEGPSIRLAEIVGSAWGNIRYGARLVDETPRSVVAQGACYDLEKNVSCSIEVSRRITKRSGQRYSDDMSSTTSQAAMSIALRNAIFRVIPMSYVKTILAEAKLVAIGKGLSMEQRRENAVAFFGKLDPRLTLPALLLLLGRRGLEDVTVDDVTALRGIATAVKDGETTVDDLLRQIYPPAEPAKGSKPTLDTLADDLPGKEPTP